MMETKITFEVLRKRHGDVEAMRILNTLEYLAMLEELKAMILSEPAERFEGAIRRLMATDLAA